MRFVIDEIEVQMCVTYVTGRTQRACCLISERGIHVIFDKILFYRNISLYTVIGIGKNNINEERKKLVHFYEGKIRITGTC